MKAIKEVYQGTRSLITGMRLTLREFFRPTVTVHYPHQTLPIPPAFRGHIELKWNAETGKANCTACNLCAKACPSDCIVVEGVKPEGEKKKMVDHYHLNYTLCSLCSLCIEACPFDAIQHSGRYNLASVPNQWNDMDLFQRYKEQAVRAGKTPYTPIAAPEAPKAPAVAAAKPASVVAQPTTDPAKPAAGSEVGAAQPASAPQPAPEAPKTA